MLGGSGSEPPVSSADGAGRSRDAPPNACKHVWTWMDARWLQGSSFVLPGCAGGRSCAVRCSAAHYAAPYLETACQRGSSAARRRSNGVGGKGQARKGLVQAPKPGGNGEAPCCSIDSLFIQSSRIHYLRLTYPPSRRRRRRRRDHDDYCTAGTPRGPSKKTRERGRSQPQRRTTAATPSRE